MKLTCRASNCRRHGVVASVLTRWLWCPDHWRYLERITWKAHRTHRVKLALVKQAGR